MHFEAFQCTDQAVALWKGGWFKAAEAGSGQVGMANPKHPDFPNAVIVAGAWVAHRTAMGA